MIQGSCVLDVVKKKKTVIVAEDDREMAEEYARILGERYAVVTCEDGRAMLDRTQGDTDLIILDLIMPGMDGIAALKKLRTFSDVPVLVISAISNEAEKITPKFGDCRYICKPFEPKQMIETVKDIIGE